MTDPRRINALAVGALMLALAAMLAGPAGARPTPSITAQNDAVHNQQAESTGTEPGLVVPYLSHGIGVDESRYMGEPYGAHTVVPYLSQGIGVDESQFRGREDASSTDFGSQASSNDRFEWGGIEVAGGVALTAVLLALGTLGLRARAGRRTAMP